MKTPLIIEQHFHGAYGVDFNKAGVNEIIELSQKLCKLGIGGFFPTLVTDSVENIKKQIEVIKKASTLCKGILGIHLEGVFINPLKKGIHNPEHFLALTPENYRKLEDEFIKIVTLAPELDNGLIGYLNEKGVKIQAGHCVGGDLTGISGVTHIFNAMAGITHREKTTALEALIKDEIYTEVIGDGIHLSDEALKLLFKSKPLDKVILISDALPITYSNLKHSIFADSEIFYDGKKAASANGTIAGSTKLLPEIIQILGRKGMFKPEFVRNVYSYHGLEPTGEIEWNEDFEIVNIVSRTV